MLFIETYAIDKYVSDLPFPFLWKPVAANTLPIGPLDVTTNANHNDPMRLYGIQNSNDKLYF